jgi:hypothetical protein
VTPLQENESNNERADEGEENENNAGIRLSAHSERSSARSMRGGIAAIDHAHMGRGCGALGYI